MKDSEVKLNVQYPTKNEKSLIQIRIMIDSKKILFISCFVYSKRVGWGVSDSSDERESWMKMPSTTQV